MELNITAVAEKPESVSYSAELDSGENITLRPLQANDVDQLARFLSGLSEETRRLSTFGGYDINEARVLCDAINKYDKLRLVVEDISSQQIVGCMEFSFDLPEGDLERFRTAGYSLNPETDCRFGPTLADDYQSQGLGSKLIPFVIDIAKRFGKRRMILWGGVLKDNVRAIKFYEKFGFRSAGEFLDGDLTKLDMILDLSLM